MTVRKWGDEIIVNTQTTNTQDSAAIAALADGGFVVTWTDRDAATDGSGSSVKVQHFDATGHKVGGETLVNTTTAASQLLADVSVLSDGSFVVVWEDDSLANGTGIDLRFRRFAADGTALDQTDRVATTISGAQTQASVSAIAGGGFIVAYGDNSTGNLDIRAQRIDGAGNQVGTVMTPPAVRRQSSVLPPQLSPASPGRRASSSPGRTTPQTLSVCSASTPPATCWAVTSMWRTIRPIRTRLQW
jgi:hypothetical protein